MPSTLPAEIGVMPSSTKVLTSGSARSARPCTQKRPVTFGSIVVPLMSGGILAGFVTSFITASVELSATILLVTRESLAPLSYGIYLYNQSIATRGPAAALGVIAVAIVGIGTWWSHRILEKRAAAAAPRVE